MSFLIKAKTMEKLSAAYRLLFSEHLIRRIRSSVGPASPKVLVANFNGVDCFTLADYVEALARSDNQKSFLHNLARTRYAAGKVAYLSRRHFFSDWFAAAPRNARDVTPDISPDYVVVDKQLNHKPDGGEYIPGLGIHPRKINYIPGRAINQQVMNHLKTGIISVSTPRLTGWTFHMWVS